MRMAFRAALVVMLLAASVSGAVLIGNLPSTGDNTELNLYDWFAGGKYAAVGFQSGAVQMLLEQVTVRLYAYDLFNMGNTPLPPLMSLYSGTNTTIIQLLAALSGPVSLANNSATPQTATYTPAAAITLSPNSFYWLVLQGQNASTTKTSWAGSLSSAKTPSSPVSFAYVEYRGGGSTIANMQTQSDRYYYFEIQGSLPPPPTGGGGGDGGNPPPGETPEVSTMILIASGLILMRFRRLSWGQTA